MPNNTFTFIHAADLHLGGGIEGLDQASAQIADFVKSAPYEALKRIVDLCIKESAQALLLAGDVYNPENDPIGSLKALSQAFNTLAENNIRVFMVHGNHDPADTRFSWQWPSNVTVFSAREVECYPVYQSLPKGDSPDGDSPKEDSPEENSPPLAVVHGISHSSTTVADNLALKFPASLNKIKGTVLESAPQVGLLHCSVISAKNAAGQGIYAPCNLHDLASSPTNFSMDYWALGHIHKGAKLQDEPLTYYSGNPQGLHIKETGPKGCLVVKLGNNTQKVSFHSLAPLRWEELSITVPPKAPFNTLTELIVNHIAKARQTILAEAAINSEGYETKGIILRLVLEGSTLLHKNLHQHEDDLLQSLREILAERTAGDLQFVGPFVGPFIWLKDIILKTKPLQDMELAKTRNDLLGEALRLINNTQNNAEAFQALFTNEDALGSLYGNKGAQKAGLTPPKEAELQNLLEEAALRCLELLSPEEQ